MKTLIFFTLSLFPDINAADRKCNGRSFRFAIDFYRPPFFISVQQAAIFSRQNTSRAMPACMSYAQAGQSSAGQKPRPMH
jgi:hypothetical protein